MHYQLTQLLILGFYIIHPTKSIFIYGLNTTKIVCHSCRGSNCETVTNNDNMVVCNKDAQLCWAGFIDQQPYRTCASRYCTPSDISIDSDIRIESCCHTNLCNSVPLPPSIWWKSTKKASTSRPETSPTTKTPTTTTKQITIKRPSPAQLVYFVDEISDSRKAALYKHFDGEQKDPFPSNVQLNTKLASYLGITWVSTPHEKGFSPRTVSISKLLILMMPVLIVLLI